MNRNTRSSVVSRPSLHTLSLQRIRAAFSPGRKLIYRYLKLLALLTIVSAVMACDLGLAILMLTLGLAFPLLFAPAALCYLLAAFPAVALWRGGSMARFTGVGISAALIAAVAIIPGFISNQRAGRLDAATQRADIHPAATSAARTLEIMRNRENYDKLFMDAEPCGYECRALLLGGRIEWVRVQMKDGSSKKASNPSTTYKAGRGAACGFGETKAAGGDRCVLVAADTGAAADLTIGFDHQTLPMRETVRGKPGTNRAPVDWYLKPNEMRTVSAIERLGGAEKLLLRQTDISVNVITSPAALIPDMRGMSIDGLTLSRSRRLLNPISLRRTLETLGFSIDGIAGANPAPSMPKDWRDSITPEMTSVLMSVLALPGSEPFNTEQSSIISGWIMHARQIKVWTPELVALLRRAVRDERLQTPTFFDQIFERNPAVTTALLPDVLELIERDGITEKYTPARQAAYTFPRIDESLLKPHARRIIALLDKGPAERDILLPSIGRVGVDPAPFLTPFESGSKTAVKSNFRQLEAACFAEKKWAPGLVTALKENLTALARTGPRENEARAYRARLLATLANLGELDLALQELAKSDDPVDARLSRRLKSNAMEKRRGANALCHF